VTFEDGLYLAEARSILERVRRLDDAAGSALVIGHNPGLEQLANGLCASPKTVDEEKSHRRMREKFSTCALAAIEFPVKAWRDVKMGAGVLKDFTRPRDL
jgi:phosphohistidine phosphatase